jgi:hypothetical protein
MCFVNTFIDNIAFLCSNFKSDVIPGNNPALTISSVVIFVLSLALATYLIFIESKKRNNQTQSDILSENNTDSTSISLSIEDQTSTDSLPLPTKDKASTDSLISPTKDKVSTDVLPATEETALQNSNTSLSAFETVSLTVSNIPLPSESSPLPDKPVPSSFKPKPLKPQPLKPKPVRPKPVRPKPIPIEPPPTYYILYLQAKPARAVPGDTIYVSFTFTSNTATSDNFPISLKVNGFEIYSNTITLGPYESKSLTYPIRAIEPGDWDIDVNNVLCKLTIVEDNR